jgi:hypothetical protein
LSLAWIFEQPYPEILAAEADKRRVSGQSIEVIQLLSDRHMPRNEAAAGVNDSAVLINSIPSDANLVGLNFLSRQGFGSDARHTMCLAGKRHLIWYASFC